MEHSLPSDGEILAEFVIHKRQASFAAIVERHGGMVTAVCRARLRNDADAHDAAQAVFLTLAQKAKRLRGRASVAGWLHRVAWYIASRAAQAQASRRHHEQEAARMKCEFTSTPDEVDTEQLHAAIDALPEKYRIALLLHHIEGRTEGETAALMNCSLSNASVRLTRGRQLLRRRLLAPDGVAMSAGMVAAHLAQQGSAAVPATFIASTSQMALAAVSAGSTATTSAAVTALSTGAMKMIFWTQMKFATGVALTVLLASILAGYWMGRAKPQAGIADSPRLMAAASERPSDAGQNASPDKDIPLGTPATLRLLFEDTEGKPLPGVRVSISVGGAGFGGGPNIAPPSETTADQNGAVIFDKLTLGQPISFDVLDERYATLQSGDTRILLSRPMTEVAGIKLTPAAVISGRVVYADGSPAAGQNIRATILRGGAISSVITDQEGKYRITRMPAGAYRVNAVLAQDAPWRGAAIDDAMVEPGQELKVKDLVLVHGAVIAGRVIDKSTGGALVEDPIPGRSSILSVVVSPFGGADQQSTSSQRISATGDFTIRVLPGNYRVKMGSAPRGFDLPDTESLVTVEEGRTYTVNLEMNRKPAEALGRSITGHVLDEGGHGVARAIILGGPVAGGMSGASATTDRADGKFEAKGVKGRVVLRAVVWKGTPTGVGDEVTASDLATVEGIEANPGDDVTLHVKAGVMPRFNGRVVDDMGHPIAGATVNVLVASGERGGYSAFRRTDVHTDANGRYEIPGVWPDVRSALNMTAPGYGDVLTKLENGAPGQIHDVPEIMMFRMNRSVGEARGDGGGMP